MKIILVVSQENTVTKVLQARGDEKQYRKDRDSNTQTPVGRLAYKERTMHYQLATSLVARVSDILELLSEYVLCRPTLAVMDGQTLQDGHYSGLQGANF